MMSYNAPLHLRLSPMTSETLTNQYMQAEPLKQRRLDVEETPEPLDVFELHFRTSIHVDTPILMRWSFMVFRDLVSIINVFCSFACVSNCLRLTFIRNRVCMIIIIIMIIIITIIIVLNIADAAVVAPLWGVAHAEIKLPSGENTELKRSPFQAWSRSV